MRDLLDLSKIESGESAPNRVPVRVGDLIDAATSALSGRADTKRITLMSDVPSDLPPVLADRAQIERVVTNLLANALRYTNAGGSIQIHAARRDGHVAISVTDTGRGIPPEYLPSIFDKFAQVPGAPSGGAGLGLAISKRIVEAHGGQIVVKSVVGHGTTFTFTLQVAAPSSAT
jgi:two-component system, NtrC family, sensor histidine kinase KinB